jgi:hypothetical protein
MPTRSNPLLGSWKPKNAPATPAMSTSAARRDQRSTESPGGSRNQPLVATARSSRSSKPPTLREKRGTSFAATVR